MPILTIPRLLLSLLSLAVLAGGAYLLASWGQGYDVRGADGVWRHYSGPTWRLVTGCALLAWSFLGRLPVLLFMRKGSARPALAEGRSLEVIAPDGAVIKVHISGAAGGPTLVLTHGWGLDSTVWAWAAQDLGARFRLVTWDLPGLGKSKGPSDGRYTIDRFAEALGAVIQAVAETPVVLVGHSIGGMTTQTLFRACPQIAKAKVAGVVLVDTTYVNPLHTMLFSRLWRALQKPLLEPMSWLTVALSPIVWLANWQSYLSGSAQLAMRLAGFGRHATGPQVDYAARLSCQGSPAVQAKGNLAMFHWSAQDVLGAIPEPVLVLAGTRDIVTLPSASEVIADAVPNTRLVQAEGAGHMGFMEAAAQYNREIARFADFAVLSPDPAPRDSSRPAAPETWQTSRPR